ncbi:MAG: hypothetical protein HYZ65_14670 [Burkholderiales bacterium]|nr:hypothetical protein [Burkholderiales bacterium]
MKLHRLVLSCAIAGALVACGGGGSDSAGNGNTPPAPLSRTLDGVAAKGYIKNGIVKVYAYGADGSKSAAPLITTRTSSSDGSYTVNLGGNIGLFTIEVSADKDTTMADEISGDIPMPVDMTLRSLVQLDSAAGANIKGYVTPFTDMLVSAASKANGGLTAANVASAQTGVVTMLGFNPLTTKPVMANSPAAATATDASEKLQSITLAALSKLANDSSNNLGCSGSVSAKIACVVGATTGAINLKDGSLSIPLAAQVAVRTAAEAVAADPAINKTTLNTLAGQTSFTQATVATGSAEPAALPATKAMFASLRNNVNAWRAALQPGAKDNPLDNMKADFDQAIAPLDKSLMDWVEISRQGMLMYKTYTEAGNTGSRYTDILSSNGRVMGYCQLSGTPVKKVYCYTTEQLLLATQVEMFRDAIIDAYGRLHPATHLTARQVFHDITLTPAAASTTSFTYLADSNAYSVYFNRDMYGEMTDVNSEGSREGALGNPVTGNVAFVADGNVLSALTINGDIPARFDDKGAYLNDKSSIALNYQRSPDSDAGAMKYAVSGEISTYKKDSTNTSVKTGTISILPDSYLRTVPDSGGDITLNGAKELKFGVSASGVSSKIAGTLTLNNFSYDKSGSEYLPGDMQFVGTLSNGSAEFFKGSLTAHINNFSNFYSDQVKSATNFVNASVAFVGIARVAGRPDLKLSLNASSPAFDTILFNAQYEDGSNTLLINSSNASPKVINLASANGVAVQFKEDVDIADVMKNGSKVASFDRNTGIITYIDGSFESLK